MFSWFFLSLGKGDKNYFPDRRKNCIIFSMIRLRVSSLCSNVPRNNNSAAGICLINMQKKDLRCPLLRLCAIAWLIHSSELKCHHLVQFSLSCPQLAWLLFFSVAVTRWCSAYLLFFCEHYTSVSASQVSVSASIFFAFLTWAQIHVSCNSVMINRSPRQLGYICCPLSTA